MVLGKGGAGARKDRVADLFFARAHKQTITLAHAQWPALVE